MRLLTCLRHPTITSRLSVVLIPLGLVVTLRVSARPTVPKLQLILLLVVTISRVVRLLLVARVPRVLRTTPRVPRFTPTVRSIVGLFLPWIAIRRGMTLVTLEVRLLTCLILAIIPTAAETWCRLFVIGRRWSSRAT